MNMNIKSLLRGFIAFFRRFQTILFFLSVSTGLAVSMLLLLSIIELSNQTGDESDELISDSFDSETIKRINELNQNRLTQQGERASPFEE